MAPLLSSLLRIPAAMEAGHGGESVRATAGVAQGFSWLAAGCGLRRLMGAFAAFPNRGNEFEMLRGMGFALESMVGIGDDWKLF
jgi:tetrahydromethanopterin S-methyltransferase subunit D